VSKIIFENIEILGFLAAMLGTISLLPQVIKVWRLKCAKSISLIMYIIICIDSILWITYGAIYNLLPLLVQASLTFVCAFLILIMKLTWG
jgi:MtN3 and saliva related transmembrane protein